MIVKTDDAAVAAGTNIAPPPQHISPPCPYPPYPVNAYESPLLSRQF
jgi:hypothetical protein